MHDGTLQRRSVLYVLAAAATAVTPGDAVALPRGGIDARVAAAFNTAFAAGGDPVVRTPLACGPGVRRELQPHLTGLQAKTQSHLFLCLQFVSGQHQL